MNAQPERQTVAPVSRLRGELVMPPDKSISHRAALLAALAEGTSRLRGFLAGEDCLDTLRAVAAFGAQVSGEPAGELCITGRGLGGLREPGEVIWAGNSGTTMRLLAGLAAGVDGLTMITGDASLCRRPMARVLEPLARMGARVDGRDGGRLAPLAIRGGRLQAIHHASPVASAQVKSAVLLAGLFADGGAAVSEPHRSRDHTERMLATMGAEVRIAGTTVTLAGRPRLRPLDLVIPGDLSSAAFWVVAATVVPDSEVVLRGVGVNDTRTGLLEVLGEMGADVRREGQREVAGEPVCDLVVRSAALRGTRVAGSLIPRLLDEVPILAVAAGCATGDTVIADAGELRLKESDRLAAVVERFGALGLRAEATPDGLVIRGGTRWRGGVVASGGDHRIAMSLAVIGLLAEAPVEVLDTACTRTSYPGFWEDLAALRQA